MMSFLLSRILSITPALKNASISLYISDKKKCAEDLRLGSTYPVVSEVCTSE